MQNLILIQKYIQPNPKLLTELQHCEAKSIEWVVLFGSSEIENGKLKIRNVSTREEQEIERANLAEVIRSKM